MRCRYAQCKLGGEVEKDKAIKIGNSYYHKSCNNERELKKQIEKLYYDKFQNKDPIQQVRKSINKYINTDDYDAGYILFTLNENIKLNSIFGLIYYLNNEKFINKFNYEKAKLVKFEVDKVEVENTNNIKYKPKQQGGWGDILCR